MQALLHHVLTARPAPIEALDARAFWEALAVLRRSAPVSPLSLAVLGGFYADRVGYAFLAGYESALRVLFTFDEDAIGSFCVTEAGGNRPRAIETRVEYVSGGCLLTGHKRWSTLAPIADVLFIVARTGLDAQGRPSLVTVQVPRQQPGLSVQEMPPPPFVPEVPHAALELSGATVSADAVIPGDGYMQHVKPFRTAEDLHVHASLLGYLIGVARRSAWPRGVVEELAASVAAAHQLAVADLSSPEVHVALSGLMSMDTRQLNAHDAHWANVHDEERRRWHRDRQLFQVAASAREARRERAWQRLEQS